MAYSGNAWPEVAAQNGGDNTWTNLANAQGTTTTGYATWTSAVASSTGRILLSNMWAQGNMIGGTKPAAITSVVLDIWSYESSTTVISAVTAQLIGQVSGPLGSPVALTRSVTTTNTQQITISTNLPTWDDMAGSPGLAVELVATHDGSSTSATFNVGALRMKIGYTSLVAVNKIREFKDTFNQNLSPLQWWAYPTFPSTNGTALVTVPSTGGTYEYMVSLEPYDLRESSISMKFGQCSGTDNWWGLMTTGFPFPVSGGGDTWYRQLWFRINTTSDGQLNCLTTDNWALGDTVRFGVAYNSGTMAYMRIRHQGATIYWDTSSDGVTWTNRTSLAESSWPTDLTYLYPFVRVATHAAGVSFLIDDLNITDATENIPTGDIINDLGGGAGAWTNPTCAGDFDNDVYATWTAV